MSRVETIKEAQEKFNQAETALSNAIFKVFYPGRKIWYQIGYSEHPSGWTPGEVLRPVGDDPFQVRIKYSDLRCSRTAGQEIESHLACGIINIDGRSVRLSIDPDPRNKQ